MTTTVPLTKLRPQLPKIMDKISRYFDRYVVTRRGKPEAVLLSDEDYEAMMETLDILSDQKLMRDLKKAMADLRRGKGISWEKAKQKLGYV